MPVETATLGDDQELLIHPISDLHRQMLRESEIWDRANGGRRFSIVDVQEALKTDLAEFRASALGAAHA